MRSNCAYLIHKTDITTSSGGSVYRPEIDGLRAIAVISVIFFHANFPCFQGGYIGVDIFFVISGFLITTFLLKSRIEAVFSLKDFYLRRAKRILPALFFILICCLPLAWLLLLPHQLLQFSQSLIAVSLFSSNLFFWQTSGYFDSASALNPLLHTWSLGIEEQFYLIFPLFILASKRLSLVQLFWACTIVLLCSLWASNYEWNHHAMANFFLLPTRVWELLAGALLAFFQRNIPYPLKIAKKYHSFLALMGLIFIFYAIVFFSKKIPNPSVFTLIPIIGTMLIIAFSKNTLVYHLLSLRPLVGLGLISYSVYLWHQPLFVFTRIYYGGELTASMYWALFLLTMVLGYFTWLYIEIPFRNAFVFNLKFKKAIPYAVWMFFLGVGIGGIATRGYEHRFEIPEEVLKSFEIPERTKECFDLDKGHRRKDWRCFVNRDPQKKREDFFLTGDSHALQLLGVFEKAAQAAGKNGTFAGFSGCIPFLGVYPLIREDQATKNCALLNQRIFNYIKKNRIKNLILVARWAYYTDGGYTSDPKLINYIGKHKSEPVTLKATRAAFEYGIEKTLKAYKALGVHIYIIPQAPAQYGEPQTVYYSAFSKPAWIQKSLDKASVSLSDHRKLQVFVTAVFKKYKKDPSVTFVDIDKVFCDKKICPIGTKKASYYQDNNHLSALGAVRLQKKLVDTFKFIT